MKILLIPLLLLASCATSNQDRKAKCLVELVREGVLAEDAAKACKSTFTNRIIYAPRGTLK